MILALAALVTAGAGEYYLETPTVSDRGDAIELQESALDEGLSARVVRRWQHGVGWGYAVVIDGLSDRETADAMAASLAALTSRGISVYAVEPEVSELVELPQAAAAPLPAVSEVLGLVLRAHGGREGGRPRLEAVPAVRFRYDRRVSTAVGEVVARHDWWGEGEALHVAVEILEGPGRDIVGEVSAQGAWVEVAGERHERDAALTHTLLDSYGPSVLLSAALDVPAVVAGEGPVILTAVSDGATLIWERGTDRGSVSLHAEPERWTVSRQAVIGPGGEVVTTFDDWREVDTGLVVPYRLTVHRDGVFVEELRVIELDLSPGSDRVP